MDFLDSFDTLFEGKSQGNRTNEHRRRWEGGDPRLDFFSHIFKRLASASAPDLRTAPTVYGNHIEYTQTFFPLVIEDTIAAIPERMEGGVRITCLHVHRWNPPFSIGFCDCPADTTIRGNELVCLEDGRGAKTFGITKRGPRVELTGGSSIEILVPQNVAGILKPGTWVCYFLADLNSHAREYTAVRAAPTLGLMGEILPKKKGRKKKGQEKSGGVVEDTIDGLNSSQQSAIHTALAKDQGIVLIQGPPGTGKTRTVVTLLGSLLSSPTHAKGGILVCAPSNTAVDEITLRLVQSLAGSSARIIRVCAYGKGDNCREVLLQNVVASTANPTTQALRRADKVAIECGAEDDAQQGWHSFEIDSLLDKRDALAMTCQRTDWSQRKDAVADADIVLCTLSMAASPAIISSMAGFETVVVDEAAQAVEPSILIPLRYGAKRLILVGDACQLPATVRSSTALKNGYGKSMFERLQEAGVPVCLLDTQYRMNRQIRSFPARYFYDDHLKDGKLTHEIMPYHDKWYFGPYVFFNIDWSTEMHKGTSVCNDTEANFLAVLLRQLDREYPDLPTGQRATVLTPYRAQVERVRQELSYRSLRHATEVGTVDGFQGREADIVILSSVRTSAEDIETATIGFLNDRRRMNVALTRARHSLWVVGNKNLLGMNADWEELIRDAERRGLLYDVTLKENHFQVDDPVMNGSVTFPVA